MKELLKALENSSSVKAPSDFKIAAAALRLAAAVGAITLYPPEKRDDAGNK